MYTFLQLNFEISLCRRPSDNNRIDSDSSKKLEDSCG